MNSNWFIPETVLTPFDFKNFDFTNVSVMCVQCESLRDLNIMYFWFLNQFSEIFECDNLYYIILLCLRCTLWWIKMMKLNLLYNWIITKHICKFLHKLNVLPFMFSLIHPMPSATSSIQFWGYYFNSFSQIHLLAIHTPTLKKKKYFNF